MRTASQAAVAAGQAGVYQPRPANWLRCRAKGTDRNTNGRMVNCVENALSRFMCVVINKTSVVHLRTNQGPIEKEQGLPIRSIACAGNALQNIQGFQTFVT